MTNDSVTEVTCNLCARLAAADKSPELVVWQNEHWLVSSSGPPYTIPGWMTLYAKRHVAGISSFNDDEANAIGPTLRWLESSLEQTTGALRIYTLAMGESAPHFHCHMVPRHADLPADAVGFNIWTFGSRVRSGEVSVDSKRAEEAIALYRERLAVSR